MYHVSVVFLGAGQKSDDRERGLAQGQVGRGRGGNDCSTGISASQFVVRRTCHTSRLRSQEWCKGVSRQSDKSALYVRRCGRVFHSNLFPKVWTCRPLFLPSCAPIFLSGSKLLRARRGTKTWTIGIALSTLANVVCSATLSAWATLPRNARPT